MKVELNLKENESQAFDGNDKIGFCQFIENEENVWNLPHTVVNPIYAGKGVAGELLDKIVEYAKENNIKLIPSCSYVRKKFDENPEKYNDVRY